MAGDRIFDTGTAPEIFSNALVAVSGQGTSVALTLGSMRHLPIGEVGSNVEPYAQVVARIVMTETAARDVVEHLSEALRRNQMVKQMSAAGSETPN